MHKQAKKEWEIYLTSHPEVVLQVRNKSESLGSEKGVQEQLKNNCIKYYMKIYYLHDPIM